MNKYYGKNAPILTSTAADREEWVELLGHNPATETLRHLGITRRKWADILSGK